MPDRVSAHSIKVTRKFYIGLDSLLLMMTWKRHVFTTSLNRKGSGELDGSMAVKTQEWKPGIVQFKALL